MRRRLASHIVILLLSAMLPSGLLAQWRNLAPGLLDTGSPQVGVGGAVAYKDGNLWVGYQDVFVSSDLGKTWTKRTPAFVPGDQVWDIDFFDNKNGILITFYEYVYLTRDGGISWTEMALPRPGGFDIGGFTVFFLGSVNEIAASIASRGLFITRDGGATWTESLEGRGNPKTYGRWITGNTCYMLKEDPSALSGPNIASFNTLEISNDRGATWTTAPKSTFLDCWTFAVDSCDPTKVCVPNEAGIWSNFPGEDSATIFYSADLGTSWSTSYNTLRYDICGSVCASMNALFAQTRNKGVIRSTDHGATWKSIGGPGSHWDTRYVVAVNDNIIFAVDTTDGSVWGTFNCGGDSLPFPQTSRAGGIMLTEDSLFIGDSILECDQPLQRVLHFRGYGCTQPRISQLTFKDSSAYSAVTTSGDSVLVTLNPVADGSATEMVLHLSDGKLDTVQLLGGVKPWMPFTLNSSDQANDTIGGTVYIPITLSGIAAPREVELILHYDPVLQYLGSYSVTGSPLDIAGEQSAGRTKLHLSNATSGVILGYAEFTVLYDASGNGKVYFDSLKVVQSPLPCEYSYKGPSPYVVNVKLPTQCGAFTLSNYLLSGKPPKLSIAPNPASQTVTLHSDRSIGDVTLELVDAVGRVVRAQQASVKAGIDISVTVADVAPGAYRLRILSPLIDATAALTIMR